MATEIALVLALALRSWSAEATASNCRGIDRVILRAASRFNRHQTRALELSKVARNGRLGDAEAPDDLLGVELPFEQKIEHAQARGIGKGARGVEQIDLVAVLENDQPRARTRAPRLAPGSDR